MPAPWSPLASTQRVVLGALICFLLLPAHVQRHLGLYTSAQAQDPFDCSVTFDSTHSFDLTKLKGEQIVTRIRETPPSRMLDEVRFDLCGDLARQDGVAEGDQCPSGTRACLTMTNHKGDNSARVIAAIPLAVSSALNPETALLSSPKGLNVVFHGSEYPTTDPIPQSLNVSLLCDTEQGDPSFISYYGAQLVVEWHTPAGCGFLKDDPPSDGGNSEEGEEKKVGSGIGWFFLLLFLAFVAYFAIGAYYNYSTYGAVGADLIPHRDFWREVPYVLRDVVSHLCTALRPSPRNGYIAV
ncbi:hypothetical protein M0805_005814 [Coniferiporia weirii]|nr:hypothetical protein M0805_005814 [Coniferiporia weirii]